MAVGNTDILVIGGGAAGFFSAIHAKAGRQKARVVIAEKTGKLLSKVLVSGGGRCNVTHYQLDNNELITHYPRGRGVLKWALRKWGVTNTIRWFEAHNVKLKTEEDGRMFPITDNSQTVADALLDTARELGIEVMTKLGIAKIEKQNNVFLITTDKGETFESRAVIIAAGGYTKPEHYQYLADMGLTIIPPAPSLFTFNIPDKKLHELMGISTFGSKVKVAGTPDWYEGPMLITHWGLSGPAILKASAWLAHDLQAADYKYTVLTDWTGMGEEAAREVFESSLLMHSAKKISNTNPFDLPGRLWDYILEKARVSPDKLCRDLSKPDKNRIIENSVRCEFKAKGKTTFKEEFVTAGGVSTSDIDHDTMGAKQIPGLFFAGEILDIDGVTGGYNFQAAWATGYVAGSSAGKYLIGG